MSTFPTVENCRLHFTLKHSQVPALLSFVEISFSGAFAVGKSYSGTVTLTDP